VVLVNVCFRPTFGGQSNHAEKECLRTDRLCTDTRGVYGTLLALITLGPGNNAADFPLFRNFHAHLLVTVKAGSQPMPRLPARQSATYADAVVDLTPNVRLSHASFMSVGLQPLVRQTCRRDTTSAEARDRRMRDPLRFLGNVHHQEYQWLRASVPEADCEKRGRKIWRLKKQ
jgi:hypothetical protein